LVVVLLWAKSDVNLFYFSIFLEWCIEFLPPGQTANKVYYLSNMCRLREAIRLLLVFASRKCTDSTRSSRTFRWHKRILSVGDFYQGD